MTAATNVAAVLLLLLVPAENKFNTGVSSSLNEPFTKAEKKYITNNQ